MGPTFYGRSASSPLYGFLAQPTGQGWLPPYQFPD